jgi:hypothetical protein
MSRWMNGGAPMSCAFCGNPFPIKEQRIEAVRVGDEFVCNDEACIDGIREEAPQWIRKGRRLG